MLLTFQYYVNISFSIIYVNISFSIIIHLPRYCKYLGLTPDIVSSSSKTSSRSGAQSKTAKSKTSVLLSVPPEPGCDEENQIELMTEGLKALNEMETGDPKYKAHVLNSMFREADVATLENVKRMSAKLDERSRSKEQWERGKAPHECADTERWAKSILTLNASTASAIAVQLGKTSSGIIVPTDPSVSNALSRPRSPEYTYLERITNSMIRNVIEDGINVIQGMKKGEQVMLETDRDRVDTSPHLLIDYAASTPGNQSPRNC